MIKRRLAETMIPKAHSHIEIKKLIPGSESAGCDSRKVRRYS